MKLNTKHIGIRTLPVGYDGSQTRMTLIHKPTRVEVSGEGPHDGELHDSLLPQLEAAVAEVAKQDV